MRASIAFLGDASPVIAPTYEMVEPVLRSLGIDTVLVPDDTLPEFDAVPFDGVIHDEVIRPSLADPTLRVMHINESQGEGWIKFQVNSSNFDPTISMWVAGLKEVALVVVLFSWVVAMRAFEDQPEIVSVEERQHLEVVLRAVGLLVDEGVFDSEVAAMLEASVETINAQLHSPTPSRSVIGRALRTVATFAGGVLMGLAGNLLTDLLQAFRA